MPPPTITTPAIATDAQRRRCLTNEGYAWWRVDRPPPCGRCQEPAESSPLPTESAVGAEAGETGDAAETGDAGAGDCAET